MKKERISIQADAEKTANSLRDTGYTIEASVADLIDNSIEAGAKNISVFLDLDNEGDVIFYLADDGCGMDKDGLINALKYGADDRKKTSNPSLGKFGMGLKTASTAHCKKLAVVSRNKKGAEPLRITMDLDNYANWECELDSPEPHEVAWLDQVAKNKSGTIVIWKSVDRVQKDYADKTSKYAFKNIESIKERLIEHLDLVFYRFLQDFRGTPKRVNIAMNGEELLGWDPFCEDFVKANEKAVLKVAFEDLETSKIHNEKIDVRGYVMPREKDIEDDEKRKRLKITNPLQGIYVFREDRLLSLPTLLGLMKEPHGSLFRGEVNIVPALDGFFEVDIKKSRIVTPLALKNDILGGQGQSGALLASRRAANNAYRGPKQKKIAGQATDIHTSSNTTIKDVVSTLDTSTILDTTGKNKADIKNKEGEQSGIKLVSSEVEKSGEVYVQPSEQVSNNCLYEPAALSESEVNHNGVIINTKHPFYEKIYVKFKKEKLIVEGLDALLYALAQAELSYTTPDIQRKLEDFRHLASRNLESLMDTFPELTDSEIEA